MSVENEPRSESKLLLLRIAIASFVTLLCYWGAVHYFTNGNFTTSAPWGDSFAPLNTLFSGLAFAAVCASLHFQRIELSLQRQELAHTRAELRRAAEAQDRLAVASELDQINRERPRVLAWLSQSDSATWYLTIRNEGIGVANALGISLDRNVGYRGHKPDNTRSYLNELPIFAGGKFVLAPSQELNYLLESYASQNTEEATFSLATTYLDSSGHKFSESFQLDFAFASGQAIRRDSGDLGMIARKLRDSLGEDRSTKRVL